MKNRWQKSLDAAVAAYDKPMPWARGEMRKAMMERRAERAGSVKVRKIKVRTVSAA